MKLRILAIIGFYALGALLTGAHFLRAGNVTLVVVSLMTPLLFLYQRRWILIVLQAMAYSASVNWIVTAFQIVQTRASQGRAWTTAAVILGLVATLTVVAGSLLNATSVRRRYPR